jgi:hypothetical protein
MTIKVRVIITDDRGAFPIHHVFHSETEAFQFMERLTV